MDKKSKAKMTSNMKKATKKGNKTPGALLPGPGYVKKAKKRK